MVSCEVLHSRGGARMTQGGANAPPPLKYGPEISHESDYKIIT